MHDAQQEQYGFQHYKYDNWTGAFCMSTPRRYNRVDFVLHWPSNYLKPSYPARVAAMASADAELDTPDDENATPCSFVCGELPR